jgi:TolB-like protein/DNA-binding winged helix-turn-helix (wHTH) protein
VKPENFDKLYQNRETRMDPDPYTQHSAFKIGELTVEPGKNLLTRNGNTYPLEPRIMDVLCELYDHAGKVVSREALIEQIWRVEFGGDDSLTRAISILRKTFRRAGQSRNLLETIPKRGYLLNVPEAQDEEPSAGPLVKASGGRRRIFTSVLVLLLLFIAFIGYRLQPHPTPTDTHKLAATEQSLAVLPFDDMSPAGDQGYFADGITDELLNGLARMKGLHVASRTSSFAFKGKEIGIPAIAQKLGVRHVLEGSVRKSGDTLRITAQLIDAQTDQRLWSQNFDRTLNTDNIFAIQDEISRAIVEKLGILIDRKNAAELPDVSVADTQSLKAYDLFLQGRKLYFYHKNHGEVFKAIDVLEQAVALDPEFARAWESLAGAYWFVGRGRTYNARYYALALKAANKAIVLNPDLGFAYSVRAVVLLLSRTKRGEDIKRNELMQDFDLGVKNDPNYAIVYESRGNEYLSLGYFDKAAADFERCAALDPKFYQCKVKLARMYLYLGRTEEAVHMLEHGVIDGIRFVDISFTPYYAARHDRDYITRMVQRQLRFGDLKRFEVPLIELILDPQKADTLRPQVEHLIANSEQPIAEATLNYIYFVIGDYAKMSGRASLDYKWQNVEAYRNSPQRKQLFIRHGQVKYWREHGFPPQCRALGADDFECN